MSTEANIKMIESWKIPLLEEFQAPYMKELKVFLQEEQKQGKIIFPKGPDIFAALNQTPLDKVKVVILGQDPYHGDSQAHGFSFSVPHGVPKPPSLVNIFKELQSDLQIKAPVHGNLENWSKQGVLLLNSVLTVSRNCAASHQGQGWEKFTDKIIQLISDHLDHVVFILWGSYAFKKGAKIDETKHLILKSPHPSPLSSYRGFFGSKPFSKANEYLIKNGRTPIFWEL